jgi:hypothetical protein
MTTPMESAVWMKVGLVCFGGGCAMLAVWLWVGWRDALRGWRVAQDGWRDALALGAKEARVAVEVRDELIAEANYWRGLVTWKNEHPDRSPTQEELDLMWDRIVAKQRQYSATPSVVIAFDGQLAHYCTLDELTAPQRRGTA